MVSWWQHVRQTLSGDYRRFCQLETQKPCTITCTPKRQVEPNDRHTAIDIQIIRSSMEAQGATVRWVDHGGMFQILMRTGRICITEEAVMLVRHQMQPSSRSSSSKTRVDPAAQSNDTQRKSETRWSGNARHDDEAQNQKKMLESCQRV